MSETHIDLLRTIKDAQEKRIEYLEMQLKDLKDLKDYQIGRKGTPPSARGIVGPFSSTPPNSPEPRTRLAASRSHKKLDTRTIAALKNVRAQPVPKAQVPKIKRALHEELARVTLDGVWPLYMPAPPKELMPLMADVFSSKYTAASLEKDCIVAEIASSNLHPLPMPALPPMEWEEPAALPALRAYELFVPFELRADTSAGTSEDASEACDADFGL